MGEANGSERQELVNCVGALSCKEEESYPNMGFHSEEALWSNTPVGRAAAA